MTEEKNYTVEEVAEILRTTPYTVRKKLREGHLSGFQFGERGPWRISQDDLDDYIKKLKNKQK